MMSTVIQEETMIFLWSVLHGAAMTLLYDVLRALRRAFPHGLLAVSAEDFMYWLTAGFLTFCFAFQRTDGVVRAYVAVGIAIGAVLYHHSVSSGFVKALAWLLTQIRRGCSCVFRRLSRIFRAIAKILAKPIAKILAKPVRKKRIKSQKTIEIHRKKGYNARKG